ncbi:MAG: hypothetical protein DME57_10985 [Verrucomicrobia bacterium]|nr:MAG: hypothetical protein DME57_10985 [Verrucomicrobiota bacterium]
MLHRVTWNEEKFVEKKQMKSLHRPLSILAVAFLFASCGEPERPKPAAVSAKPFRAAGDFDDVGKVSFAQGETCATQIVFVFHGGRSTAVFMAAPLHVSKILTEAAHDHKTVRVAGKWRHGKTAGCNYVEATQAEVQKSFW